MRSKAVYHQYFLKAFLFADQVYLSQLFVESLWFLICMLVMPLEIWAIHFELAIMAICLTTHQALRFDGSGTPSRQGGIIYRRLLRIVLH
jgi:NO-binding membrane sensor protein with MHYT domain